MQKLLEMIFAPILYPWKLVFRFYRVLILQWLGFWFSMSHFLIRQLLLLDLFGMGLQTEGDREVGFTSRLIGTLVGFMRRVLFHVLSMGPIPNHLAFILDGNRRYAKKWGLEEGAGHKAGFLALMSMMKYCYELGVKYVTIYAFSIDNFKRKPREVQYVMDLMREKIEGLINEKSIVKRYGVKVLFIGNLKLLPESVRIVAEKAMELTAKNTNIVLLICVAYTSTDEIAHSAEEACLEKLNRRMQRSSSGSGVVPDEDSPIRLVDIERHMYMGVAPDPDVLFRTSGETRLSNFLLWQTTNCLLYSPKELWPEIGLYNLVWAVLNFQRYYSYGEKNRKKQQRLLLL